MTYLDLCKKVRMLGGMSGTGPASVDGQTGEMGRVVEWVAQAWLDLQSSRTDWPDLWVNHSETVDPNTLAEENVVPVAADARYTLLHTVRIDDGRVSVMQRPDRALKFLDLPEAPFELSYEYYSFPQALINSGDEPWLPEHLQHIIVYQALAYYAAYEDAPEVYSDATQKVNQYSQRMVNELLPAISRGAPLA